MNWLVIAIGKPKLAFAKAGVEEYTTRLQTFARLELSYKKAGNRDAESAALLDASAGCFRVCLDERGEAVGSRALSEKIANWEQMRVKKIAVLVGGADGHSQALRSTCDWTWSLSPLTFQHELALVMLLEQLYRAYSIKSGLPYHRD